MGKHEHWDKIDWSEDEYTCTNIFLLIQKKNGMNG